MKDATLISEIQKWIMTHPYWSKYVADKILRGIEINEEVISNAYKYFLEDNDLAKKVLKREEIDLKVTQLSDKTLIEDLNLVEVNKITNVNALADNQKIEFSPNLTVIYGSNGSGKTGYIRLFNNAFNSRGEKDILPNVFTGSTKRDTTCCFKFKNKDNNYDLEYPKDKTNQEFLYFSVFDNTSVRVHLDKENELFFMPNGFEYFGKLIECYGKMQKLLEEEIKINLPKNDFILHFTTDSEIKEFVKNLSASTNIVNLDKLANFTEEDDNALKSLETRKVELLALNVDAKVAELNKITTSLNTFKDKLIKIQNILVDTYLATIKSDITDLTQKEEMVKQSGIDRFKTDIVKETGSKEWKLFIESAYQFAKKQDGENIYPGTEDYCLLCLQPLSKQANQLINSYWDFINSTIEEEAKKSIQKLQGHKTELEKIDTNLLPGDSILTQWLNQRDKLKTEIWTKEIDDARKQIGYILENIANKNWLQVPINKKFKIEELEGLTKEVQTAIKDLQEKNPADEVIKIDQQIALLKSKSLLKGFLPSIKEYIDKLKWAKKATSKKTNLNSKSITAKQSELFNIFITESYKNIFNSECEKLNAQFGIMINQKGQKGRTVRQLRIVGYEPKKVLSEGEQRAISLSDFLTEITLSGFNKGIIFDDPVNSLDHERKKVIAQRLSEESRIRQVIVFTHDLVFLYYLKNYLTDYELDFKCHWIQKRENVPGNIFLNNSPDNEREYKNTTKAQEYYKKSKDTTPQEQEYFLKQGFGALRTNYENFVIFDLFGEVVLRFNERVSIGRLKDLVFPEDVIQQVIQKTDELSRYIEPHLHSDEFAAVKPTPELLNLEIQAFIALKNKLKDYKKQKKQGVAS